MGNYILNIKKYFSYKKLLFLIISAAFLVRLAGIDYGLPLWLVGDEPSLITGALKMIELKTVLPFLHIDKLKATLYFPPYMAYLYMPFFIALIGFKYLFFFGTMDAFKNYLISDLSAFFILVRIIHVILGTATVYLVYKISKNIFQKEGAALLGAAFLAFSALHTYLSFAAYHWVPATFLLVLAIYIISNTAISFKKRYLLGALISGIAFGVSLIAGFIMVFMLCWYLFYEKHSLFSAFKEKILCYALAIFLALAAFSILLYPFGFHLSGDNTAKIAKPLLGLMISPYTFLKPVFFGEPVLMIFFIIGLIFAYKKMRNFFWASTVFIVSYAAIFYQIYFYNYRFTVYLNPIISLIAGYGGYCFIETFRSKTAKTLILLTLLIPIASTVKLDYLALNNDSRIQAKKWAENNIPAESKVLVYGDMMRLSSTPEAIKEQQLIDPASLRQVDYAEMNLEKDLSNYRQFHALNLYSVNKSFFNDLKSYAAKNNYQYLILELSTAPNFKAGVDALKEISLNSKLLQTFGDEKYEKYLRDGNLDNLIRFLKKETAGPLIQIYELKPGQ